MKKVLQMIAQTGLQQADAIVLKKKFFGMVDHFAVFLGYHAVTNEPVFAANYTKGTQWIKKEELEQFIEKLEPERVERFQGTERERREAVERALSKIGEENYSYFNNNCEHYKNFVQTGIPHSQQVEDAKNLALILGGGFLLVGLLGELLD